MTRNLWYVLARMNSAEEWTCTSGLSKETAMAMSEGYDSRGMNSVVGYVFPQFCTCPSRVVTA